MNLDSLSFALSQITYSVANLTKKNYRSSVPDILNLVAQHGAEADRHLYRCLFSHVDFSSDGKTSGKDFHQTQFLIDECPSLLKKSNFISILCYSVDNPLHQQKTLKPSAQTLPQIGKVLKLNKVQEVIFGLALLNSSNSETANYASQFVKQKLPDLLRSYIDTETSGNQDGGLQDAGAELLHILLSHICFSKDQCCIGSDQKEAFFTALRKDFPRDRVPVILAPLIFPDKKDPELEQLSPFCVNLQPIDITMENSLANLISEVGYSCTLSVEECRGTLLQFGIRDITAASVSRVIGMMAKSPTGTTDSIQIQNINQTNPGWTEKDKPDTPGTGTWNIEIFVKVIQDLTPHINWKEVIAGLDHENFLVTSKIGFRMLMQGLCLGLQEVFPVEYFYRPWKNTEGQLSIVTSSLKFPDVFSFADYPCHHVSTELLKSPPDDDNREISTWKSLDLVETLLRLSESGHTQHIQELFKFPIQNCPDMLVLALLQITPTWNNLKHELLASLMPIFLGNHPNSAIVLHYAWHCQGQSTAIRTLIMHSMAQWYMRGEPHDQMRLSRILDVAQDLKALSMLLNASPFVFVIDMACLASRREYLKLDKWLTDKIREHGESFISALVAFLKRRCPQLLGPDKEPVQQPKAQQLPPDTVSTMLSVMEACAPSVAKDLSENIMIMVGNGRQLLKARQQGQFPPQLMNVKTMNPPPIPGLGSLDALGNGVMGGMGALGLTGGTNSPFPQGLTAFNSTPVSKGNQPSPQQAFNSQAQQAFNSGPQQAFNSLASQFGGLGLQNQPGLPPNPAQHTPSSLTSMGGQSTVKQQNAERLRQEISQQFTKDIEDEANSYFQRIYNHPPHPTLSIDEVLEMLKRFKDSQNRKERDVFACMLRNLFEEYRFFPQYPEKELHTTAVLFGGIIEQGLVPGYIVLGIALRYVLEALRKPPSNKMHLFGIAALDRFKTRLKEYPQYCQHLAGIPHFSSFPPHLIEFVECGARSQEPPPRQQGQMSTPSLPQTSTPTPMPPTTTPTPTPTSTSQAGTPSRLIPSIANATNIDTLLAGAGREGKEEISVPPESLQDKVFFIFNNLSQSNMSQKAEELKDSVTEEYLPWVAQYLVMKRASIEPNFHSLYSNFLDTLQIPTLATMVLNETYRNIKIVAPWIDDPSVLLQSDKGVANFSDRTLLKNLGHWLGLLTLGHNKPILHVDIDLKALLYNACHKGAQELLYVVPFVAKILESCAKSKVFKPPNPWTLAIMNVLYELHQLPDLKLNLKFEIEVLCKSLNIEISELKNTNYLHNPERLAAMEQHQMSPQKKDQTSTGMQQQSNEVVDAMASVIQNIPTNIPTPTPVMTPVPIPSVPPTSTPGPSSASVPTPPQPQFSFHDIQVDPSLTSLAGLAQHIIINDTVMLFQAHPQLKQYVRASIERSVKELLIPVADRSVKIALTTCEQIARKDFALDPEETRMRLAAHHMVRNLCAGMALITCRDPLLMSINNNLKTAFLGALRGATQPQKELIEQASQIIAQDNTELACAYIQKYAVEKAIPEIDKRLATEYELRKHARNEGRRYCDAVVLTYQAERMPEQIRLKVGGVTPNQIAVYEEFARNVPGFLPSPNDNFNQNTANFLSKQVSQQPPPQPPTPNYTTDEITQIYDKIAREIEQMMMQIIPNGPLVPALRGLLEAVMMARNSREIVTAHGLLQKAVEGLLDGITAMPGDPDGMIRYRDAHLLVLRGLQDPRAYGPQWTNKQVTRCLIDCREDYRYNVEAVDILIRSHLVNMQQYDLHLAQSLDNGLNYMAVAFAMQLVQRFCIDDKHGVQINEADFFNTIEGLTRIATLSRQAPDGLTALIETIRQHNDGGFLDRLGSGPTSMMHSGISQAREFDDPPGLHEKTEFLLRDWVNLYHSAAGGRDSTKAFAAFVSQMHQGGILKTDDLITRFFRLCTEMCVDLCYRALGEQTHNPSQIRARCFHTLDAFVRLITLLIKHSGDTSNTVTKINLLNKVLGIVAGVLLQDHEVRGTDFQQLPYHRIFITLFIELNAPEHVLETINFQVLTAFCNTLHILRPAKAPGFAYAWLELVSHRVFMGRMLAITPQQRGWSMYAQLLIDLFKFLGPFLRNADLTKPTQLLYRGTLRVLLVLLHDFPEFLCDYHYVFCDVIPPNCIQMRNLILSAFPRNMRLPDPFTPNLKVDMLPEIAHAPRIVTNYASTIQPPSFRKDLDSYLKTRSAVTFLTDLRSNLQVGSEPGSRYNIPLINALVLYVGTQAIQFIHSKSLTPSMSTIAHSSHMDIFQNLAVNLDNEGRYLFLNAIANQLRYPNSHTHYFSCTLLYLFAEANMEAIQEQVTRVLLERLIVNRPHPWGLLVTFIELIKNPQFKFWNHEFVHCAPEIETLFESVARSCMQHKQAKAMRDQDGQESH